VEALNVAGAPVDSKDDSSESQGSSVVTSDQESEEEEEEKQPKEEVGKEKELAVQGGIALCKVDRVAVSCNCICILFCIPVIVM